MQVDFLILGQGLAGSLLSGKLLKAGKTIMVIDNCDKSASSRVCGGIINPVTGKRWVKSWMIDQMLPFAWDAYREMEREFDTPLIRKSDVLDFHPNPGEKSVFQSRLDEHSEYLEAFEDAQWNEYFNFNFGVGRIVPCLVLDTIAMLNCYRSELTARKLLIEEQFDWSLFRVDNGFVQYRDITARKIICCDGAPGDENPYFSRLPWSKDKGEVLIAEIPGLPVAHIYKHGIALVPKDGYFWIGATHDWKYTHLNPTPEFRKLVTDTLDRFLKIPYKIVDHWVGRRPAHVDRKPFVGLHPAIPEIGVFNGMGGKGCSFAPWFADAFSRFLNEGIPIPQYADVGRYKKILQKTGSIQSG